ncbi:MAG TPA: glycine cleavage system protein H [Rubrivivax sp.]|nr:glycine cleavage system protein H [Rubrivivax sp.]
MNLRDLHFPAELCYHVEHQVWARRREDGAVAVGITALGIRLSGEIYMCRPKPVGSVVEQGRSLAVVELAKAIVSVKSPVGGKVLQVNPALADAPELVHTDPYGQGWLAVLEPADWVADGQSLIHGDAVLPAMRRHAALYPDD